MTTKRPIVKEPDFETACQWWTDLTDIWTPIGWKDHLFRFNVLWNGTIIANPHLNRRTEAWKGQGVQLAFIPNHGPELPWPGIPTYVTRDDGMVRQGWNGGPAPVLWSEWSHGGLLMRQEVFAHLEGGQAVQTGIEPLFAWVRLGIHHACPALPLEKDEGILIKINAQHFSYSMAKFGHEFPADISEYPRPLAAEPEAYSPEAGLRLVEEGKVRLAIAPGQACTARLLAKKDKSHDLFLFVQMPARVGAHVDLLIPMLPAGQAAFNRELALGYEGALAQANRYWSVTPPTETKVDIPEIPLNEIIKHNLRFAEVIAEKNPADGQTTLLSGSLYYADLWTTPHSQACVMFLDTLGCHATVEKYLEIFRKEQGTVCPPGDYFTLHPGYLSTPKTLTSIDWFSDHGALLYTICEHALLSGNEAFIARWTEAVVKACEFIQYARSIANHPGVKGLMPPAVANDSGTKFQAVWNDGWNYKGLAAAVKLLRRIGHSRASEFDAEAADYRAVFQAAFRAKAATLPAWTDDRGQEHPFAPLGFFGEQPAEIRSVIYLDGGPLFLVYAGLLPADDPLMRSTLLWFREGPQTRLYRPDANYTQVACLEREISSFEPCYSWNVFHSWQLGDRKKFLEGMYSLFAGSISRKTFISCESRGGITGAIFSSPLAIYLARLAVVDDQLREDELHLLRLMPGAWLKPGEGAEFERMPTEFGPVSLRTRVSRDGRRLDIVFKPAFRAAPRKLLLHVPPLPGLRGVRVNGRAVRVPKSGVLDLNT